MCIPINWVLRKHGCIYQPTGKEYFLPKIQFFGHFGAKNGHFQDKTPINQLKLKQFFKLHALQIIGYSLSMGQNVGIQKKMEF